jgi:NADPH2:quinone reductase
MSLNSMRATASLASTPPRSRGGGYAEYALTPSHMTFHIPATTSFEEAATVPLTAMTAAVLLYSVLGLPAPWAKPEPAGKMPLVVYGAASAVGAYAVQLARRSGIHPLICISGRGGEFVEGLVDRGLGDVVLDYRKGNEQLVKGIRKAVPEGGKLMFAFDAVAGKGSVGNICQVLSREGGKLAMVLPPEEGVVPKGIVARQGQVGVAFNAEKELGFA